MSDRSNRDVGNKRESKKHKNECGCWHCETGATKKRVKKARVDRDDLKEIRKELGYSRVGRNNV